jgi:hypothetical protein
MRQLLISLLIISLPVLVVKAQWSEQTSGITAGLNSVNAVNNNVVWTCGASGIVLRTTNGGTTWTSVTSPNATLPLYNIWGVDANTALVTGSTANTFVYKTTNGGGTWTQVFTQTGGFIDAITQRITTSKLLMVGDPVGGRWSIWKSDDAGSTWDSTQFYLPQAGSETGFNNSFFLHPILGGWFGTNNTRVYHRISASFTSQPTPGLLNSVAIWFNDGVRGMTGSDILLATVNGGGAWTTLTAPGTGTILGITGAGNNWWYVRGNSIYYSSNNGVAWSTDYTAPAGTFDHISMSRSGTSMWAVRSNGGIAFSLGPVGIRPISTGIPDNYSLNQNFPNPFNPSTNIKFDIPRSSFTKLIVYDILGNEVTNLVNEELKPGNYEVTWYANYPSGVYFYKLQAGKFNETKRMVLIK